jgi:hypothetical protein
MTRRTTFVGGAPLHHGPRLVEGAHVDLDGERFYRIANYDAMPPFLMTLVSDSDHWMFVSSNGALTAGRRDPDHALFPYYTDDRIHDSQEQTGSKTILLVTRADKTCLWEPFSTRYEGVWRVARNLYKSVYGNKLVFEETNQDLALSFSYAWMTSERFGFVRRSTLANLGGEPASVDLIDGIQNIMPAGLTRRFQLEYSTLADGYKESELDAETGVALYRLSSIPVDKAEPSESLRANAVWSQGLGPVRLLLSGVQLDRFRQGLSLDEEAVIRGRRGAYFLNARVALDGGERKEWRVVADVDKDAAGVAGIDVRADIDEDVARGSGNLVRIVASADGLQHTADELSRWRHFSNTLFNVMRGGIPDGGYRIARADFSAFVAKANREVAERQRSLLQELPETMLHADLLALARERGEADLERLAYEYLPFTFSRRHGDPSRPWNIFAIELKDEHGGKILNYQGNWRDIFQNWEALALSFPGYIESMIFKFVDASTADGYNPYRVTRDGFDWEVADPHDPWSYIGYWGDHQVIYLLKLLEESAKYHPGTLAALLTRRVFTYANIPYRIRPYDDLLRDPHNTVDFDAALNKKIEERVAELGADGKFLRDGSDTLQHVNLTEKLLVLVLARLVNYIPGAGIWMNTQRPEWNDANNALVGYGVSMVTLYYLRRFVSFCAELFARPDGAEVSAEVAEMLREVAAALDREALDGDRRRVLDALGGAGSRYRSNLYARGLSGEQTSVRFEDVRSFCALALRHIDRTIATNRRDDGLYHAYNLMKVTDSGEIVIRRLYEMLEGQVAVLSSGALPTRECIALLDALRRSSLYRADQNSYVLYPDRRLPRFREKNNIPEAELEKSPLLLDLLRRGDRSVVVRDARGVAHFNADFRNAGLLRKTLEELKASDAEQRFILDLYEEVFDHQSFTGRSGTFYKYEGLGCIYWHMVSKLALAVGEIVERAVAAGEDPVTVDRLRSHYREIREGIGVHKSPDAYGAIPTDPYSHTPGFAGVQQPGMTGQVKEDFIARFGEMGVVVKDGRIRFSAALVDRAEFVASPATFRFFDVDGEARAIDLERDTLAFTVCQVPVVAHCSGPGRVEVRRAEGGCETAEGLMLDAVTSAAVFERTGLVRRLDVFFAMDR